MHPESKPSLRCSILQIPVYVWAPEEEGLFKPGRCSRWWLHQSLKAFEKDLAALGTSMVYRRSRESCISLVQLVQETGAQVLPLQVLTLASGTHAEGPTAQKSHLNT